MNPYKSPLETPTRRQYSWRLIFLLPAALLLSAAGYQLLLQWAVYERAKTVAHKLPPTMYTEHAGFAVSCLALSVVFALMAFSKRQNEGRSAGD